MMMQVTYTVDISGRKRETTQDRLSHVTDTMPWHPNSGTLALEPPPRPSGSSRVPYDAATAAPAAVSTVALVQRAHAALFGQSNGSHVAAAVKAGMHTALIC